MDPDILAALAGQESGQERRQELARARNEVARAASAADTTRAARRNVAHLGIPAATADSIFGALGEPERRILYQPGGGGGTFTPSTRSLTMFPGEARRSPGQSRAERGAEVLAHELAHQATRPVARYSVESDIIAQLSAEAGLVEPSYQPTPPDLQGFMGVYMDRLRSAPYSKQLATFEDYFGSAIESTAASQLDRAGVPVTPDAVASRKVDLIGEMLAAGPEGFEVSEVMAKAIERGFSLARRADPTDPSKLSDQVREADEAFPGTREAFNFWMRSFTARGER